MIYFDNAATTRALPEVAEKMTYMMCENFGNPATVSVMGLEAEKEIRKASEILANGIRAKAEKSITPAAAQKGITGPFTAQRKAMPETANTSSPQPLNILL